MVETTEETAEEPTEEPTEERTDIERLREELHTTNGKLDELCTLLKTSFSTPTNSEQSISEPVQVNPPIEPVTEQLPPDTVLVIPVTDENEENDEVAPKLPPKKKHRIF